MKASYLHKKEKIKKTIIIMAALNGISKGSKQNEKDMYLH